MVLSHQRGALHSLSHHPHLHPAPMKPHQCQCILLTLRKLKSAQISSCQIRYLLKTATSTSLSAATPSVFHLDPTSWKSSSSSSDLSATSSDATLSEVASIDSTKEIQAEPLRSKPKIHDVPFLGPIEVLQCDAGGGVYNSAIHDIHIRIPEEAVDQKVNLEFGSLFKVHLHFQQMGR